MHQLQILVVCPCPIRGKTIGLIEDFLVQFDGLIASGVQVHLFDTHFYQDHNPKNYKVSRYYGVPKRIKERVIRKIPVLRAWYAKKCVLLKFHEIISLEHYDLVVLYQMPSYSDHIVRIAHGFGSKVALFPWGSEVLRANKGIEEHLKIAFSETDFVVGYEGSNLLKKARDYYRVDENRVKDFPLKNKGFQWLQDLEGKKTREEMISILGIPNSPYIIICGYNGYKTQRHTVMINAIASIKGSLPKDYILVFPMTYAAPLDYVEELKSLCEKEQLHSFFLTQYMSDEQIAYLHLITDLFINIQPTDNGNAFMLEALFCNNQILTGSWLNYNQFEKFGIPYHTIDSLNDLPQKLNDIFTGKAEKVRVPQELIDKYRNNMRFDMKSFWQNLL